MDSQQLEGFLPPVLADSNAMGQITHVAKHAGVFYRALLACLIAPILAMRAYEGEYAVENRGRESFQQPGRVRSCHGLKPTEQSGLSRAVDGMWGAKGPVSTGSGVVSETARTISPGAGAGAEAGTERRHAKWGGHVLALVLPLEEFHLNKDVGSRVGGLSKRECGQEELGMVKDKL